MRSTAFRSVGVALCLVLVSSAVSAGSISIRFDQLEEYARTKSTAARIIEFEMEQVVAERDKALEWSNPEISYDREDVGLAEEYQITLGKRFELPWATMKKRSGWKSRVTSADFRRQQRGADLLTELKTGYVRLKLLDSYLIRLGQLKEIITDVSQIASSRRAEGHLSGIDDHLIQMTVISLHSGYQSVFQDRRERESRWRAVMGLQIEEDILLTTEVEFRTTALQSIDEYSKRSESQPGYQAQLMLSEALGKFADSERGRFIPDISLYGGYKKVNPSFDGYVAGISLSLPLFNRNGASARQFDIRQRIVKSEAEVYRTELFGRVGTLVESIEGYQQSLALVTEHVHGNPTAMDKVLFSYEEGWMTLNELLNAIQIEAAGLGGYYDQLIQYYGNIFELEAITATRLVNFGE